MTRHEPVRSPAANAHYFSAGIPATALHYGALPAMVRLFYSTVNVLSGINFTFFTPVKNGQHKGPV